MFNKHQFKMLKTLNFIRKLNKNKKKAIWLKTSHFREGKRKLPALLTANVPIVKFNFIKQDDKREIFLSFFQKMGNL